MAITNIDSAYNLTLAELRIFCMICESKNVSQVAAQMGVSQSAISQMMQRWRGLVGDQLFVRSRYGVVPTEGALTLRKKIQPLLDDMQLALAEPMGFDPSKSDRTFKLHLSDIGQWVFLPQLVCWLKQQAPYVRLSVRNVAWDEIETALGSGDLDIAVGSLPMIKGRVHARHLRSESYVTVMRGDHPLAGVKLDLTTFAAAEHLVIDAASSGHALVEEVLRAKGVQRRIGLTIPHYLAAERVLIHSDYLLTVPEVAVSAFHEVANYQVKATPLALPKFDARVHWHERSNQDEGVQWLKSAIIMLFNS